MIVQAAVHERHLQALDLLLAELVLACLLRCGIAVGHRKLQIGLIAANLLALDACPPLALAVQQVDLFEVAVGLPFFVDQNGKAHFQYVTDVLQVVGATPFVARPSAVDRLLFLANLRGDIVHAPIHPVRDLGLAPWIKVEFFGYAGHVNRLLGATRA